MVKETEVSIADAARYILEQTGQITTMKLQKLCYYSQVWHCHHLQEKLFKEDLQAWSYGPVSYELFELHRGKYQISKDELARGNSEKLSDSSKRLVDEVLKAYGHLSGAQLSDLSHKESPWIDTRQQVSPSNQSPVISIEKMIEFASSSNGE